MNCRRSLGFILLLFFCQEAVAWDACLEWDPISDRHLLFYRVYRGDGSGMDFVKAGFAGQPEGAKKASYCEVGLSPHNRQYQYAVTAVNGALLESEASNQVEATLPVTLVFPQFIDGQISGSRNTTRIILRNYSDNAEDGLIEFFDAEGARATVSIGSVMDNIFEYSIPAWGTVDLLTDGNGELISGAIEIVSNLGSASRLEGTLVFQLLDNGASTPDSPPGPPSKSMSA